jgi:hypothetical protein
VPPRICTACDEPHVTRDWYLDRGDVECAVAHEDRLRRETREKYTDNFQSLGHRESIVARSRFVQPLGMTTRDDQ